MASYKVELSATAEKTYLWLAKRDAKLFKRIQAALGDIRLNPLSGKPLKGVLKDDRSYRVGSHRIVYTFRSGLAVIYVIDIGDRKDAYR